MQCPMKQIGSIYCVEIHSVKLDVQKVEIG